VKLSVVFILFDFNSRASYKLFAAGLTCLLLLATYASPAIAKKKTREVSAESTERSVKVKKRKAQKVQKALAKTSPSDQKVAISSVNDIELAGVYKAISQGQSASALGQIEALLLKAPNYNLLHLLRADVLLILSQKYTLRTNAGTSYALPALNATHQQRINELQQEAALRLGGLVKQHQLSREPLIPKQLLKLADNEPFALVVDSKMSRLYVYQNIPNAPPKLVSDYYVTQGAQGNFKLKEGDNRTPIGTYFINGPVTQKLPDLYGYGALNIDYPNAWDKKKGRTGHGIWLHGTPSETYARPPYASNGCVVLANPDVEMIFKLAKNGSMPIVVVDKLEWVDVGALEKNKSTMLEALEQWRISLEKGDLKILGKSYSKAFSGSDSDKKNVAMNPSKIMLSNVAAIEYPGETDMVITRFEQSNAQSNVIRKQLYWKKESGDWKIILENIL
jgi:murein L,D-transpeptidase YafK